MPIEELRAQALKAVRELPDDKIQELLDHLQVLGARRIEPGQRSLAGALGEPSGRTGLLKYRGVIHIGPGEISEDLERARRAMAEEADEY